jgi:DNA-directed RNA polymerase subunit K/omega
MADNEDKNDDVPTTNEEEEDVEEDEAETLEEEDDGVEGAEPPEEDEEEGTESLDEEDEEEDEEEEEGTDNLEEDGVEGAEPLEEGESAEPVNKKSKRSVGSKKNVVVTDITMLAATKTPAAFNNTAFDEESDEDEDEEENIMQKFDSELRDNFILNYHPESRTHNYEEVKALARVTRDGRGIIMDPMHKTLPFLTKYEMTRVLGQRAKQLDSGAKPFVKIPLNIIDGYHIAQLELEQKKIPFIIKRPFPNGGIEYWHVNDLEIL